MREALNQLASEGFVQRQAQRGFSVAPASMPELHELVQTRCWVEAIALREAIACRTSDWEAAIRASFNELAQTPRSTEPDTFRENPGWEGAHQAFHRALIATCPSRWLIGFCRQLSDHATRYRRLAMFAIYPNRDVTGEHQAIMDATLAGDTTAAVAALEHHYRRTASIVAGSGLHDPGLSQ